MPFMSKKFTAPRKQQDLPMICYSRKCASKINKNCMTAKKNERMICYSFFFNLPSSSSSSFSHFVEQVVCSSKRSHQHLQEVAYGAPRLFPWLPRGRATPLWLRPCIYFILGKNKNLRERN